MAVVRCNFCEVEARGITELEAKLKIAHHEESHFPVEEAVPKLRRRPSKPIAEWAEGKMFEVVRLPNGHLIESALPVDYKVVGFNECVFVMAVNRSDECYEITVRRANYGKGKGWSHLEVIDAPRHGVVRREEDDGMATGG